VECCYQNVGIATSLALTMFEGNDLNEAMGVPLFYGFCEAVLVGFYCIGSWKAGWSKAPADAPFWKILFATYEVLEAEKQDASEIEISMSTSVDNSAESQEGHIFTTYFQVDNTQAKEPSGNVPTAHVHPESALI
jgi:hypothetical protein